MTQSSSTATSTPETLRIGFLGAGQMATALTQGLLRSGTVNSSAIVATDVSAAAVQKFQQTTGARTVASAADLLLDADVIFLAVKPQHLSELLLKLQPHAESRHLFISIAAGITLERLGAGLGPVPRIIRVMPNTPCLVGAGASAFCRGPRATDADAELVKRLLETGGLALEVPEKLLDVVTGLSGSGPAYVYVMIEALSDGGVRMGMPRDIATQLAAQTVLGAAQMVLQTGTHPGALKDAVTSPGGTTIAGLHALEQGGFRAALINAVQAATLRSIELRTA